jgi:hypothetical protein
MGRGAKGDRFYQLTRQALFTRLISAAADCNVAQATVLVVDHGASSRSLLAWFA